MWCVYGILALIAYAGCVDLYRLWKRKKGQIVMDAGKGFVNLSVMVGIFFSGLSFGLGHLYIGFGFAIWVALALAVLFSMKEE